MEGVVHCLVVVDGLQLLDPVVGCPLVAVNLGPRRDMASDDGEESLCSTDWYNAHDPQCWRLSGIGRGRSVHTERLRVGLGGQTETVNNSISVTL